MFDTYDDVGPLQTRVSEIDLANWQNVDWTMFSSPDYTSRDAGDHTVSGNEGLYDFGFNYCELAFPVLRQFSRAIP